MKTIEIAIGVLYTLFFVFILYIVISYAIGCNTTPTITPGERSTSTISTVVVTGMPDTVIKAKKVTSKHVVSKQDLKETDSIAVVTVQDNDTLTVTLADKGDSIIVNAIANFAIKEIIRVDTLKIFQRDSIAGVAKVPWYEEPVVTYSAGVITALGIVYLVFNFSK